MRTVGERPWRGSVTVPFMWTAASRWAAGRVLVGPVGSEAVVLGGGGGGGGGVPLPRNVGRAAPTGAPRPWSGLMYVSGVGKGVQCKGPEASGGRV